MSIDYTIKTFRTGSKIENLNIFCDVCGHRIHERDAFFTVGDCAIANSKFVICKSCMKNAPAKVLEEVTGESSAEVDVTDLLFE